MKNPVPEDVFNHTGMLIHEERSMLHWLTRHMYRGIGEIVELGVFLGSSSASLASGLEANDRVREKNKRIHSYDRFFGDFEKSWIEERLKIQLDEKGYFGAIYNEKVKKYESFIDLNEGDLTEKKWDGRPIEILFVDVLKMPELADVVVREFFPYLVPGRSVLIMQDYIFNVLPYNSGVMAYFEDLFAYAGDTVRNSMLFVPTQEIPRDMCEAFHWRGMSNDVKLALLTRALATAPSHFARECIAHQISDFITGKYR